MAAAQSLGAAASHDGPTTLVRIFGELDVATVVAELHGVRFAVVR